jgi:hypothetical protein
MYSQCESLLRDKLAGYVAKCCLFVIRDNFAINGHVNELFGNRFLQSVGSAYLEDIRVIDDIFRQCKLYIKVLRKSKS